MCIKNNHKKKVIKKAVVPNSLRNINIMKKQLKKINAAADDIGKKTATSDKHNDNTLTPLCINRRRLTRRRNIAIKTSAALFIMGSIVSISYLQYNNPDFITKLSWQQYEQLPHIHQTIFNYNVPRRLGRNPNPKTRTALSTTHVLNWEREWEKSEDAFQQIQHHLHDNAEKVNNGGGSEEDYYDDKNPFDWALEGIEGIFKLGDSNKKNLRKERRMKAAESGGRDNDTVHAEGGEQQQQLLRSLSNWMHALTNSPLAAPLVAFFGIIFLIASYAMKQPDRRRNIILDENEAEIIEFYERELECGTLQTIPFLQDVKLGAEEHSPLRRQGSSGGLERKVSDSSLTNLRHSVSDPAIQESQCDLYYSRVLETLHYDDDDDKGIEGDGKEEEEEADQQATEAECDDQEECQITLLENISSLTEDDSVESAVAADDEDQDQPVMLEDTDEDTCFKSAQSHLRQECPQSPQSANSSISSLTLEGYDIEAPSPSASVQPLPTPTDSAPTTPLRSNRFQDRQPSCLVEGETKLSKRVSFSSNIKVNEIPRQSHQHDDDTSSEMYLYVMLFLVAIAIVVFSCMPTNPSLSPMYSAKEEIFERAEKMLTSTWDVEL